MLFLLSGPAKQSRRQEDNSQVNQINQKERKKGKTDSHGTSSLLESLLRSLNPICNNVNPLNLLAQLNPMWLIPPEARKELVRFALFLPLLDREVGKADSSSIFAWHLSIRAWLISRSSWFLCLSNKRSFGQWSNWFFIYHLWFFLYHYSSCNSLYSEILAWGMESHTLLSFRCKQPRSSGLY